VHLIIADFGDETEVNIFATHNERDAMLENMCKKWRVCGGTEENEPFASLDIMAPMDVNARQLSMAMIVLGAIVLRTEVMHVRFHSNF
jgi:hypothetical protein